MSAKRSVLFRIYLFICFSLSSIVLSYSQIVIDDTPTATQIASEIVGPGITISNVTMNCPGLASGVFSNGNSTNLGIDRGVVLTTGKAVDINNPGSYFTSISNGGGNETLLTNISNPSITFNDVCRIEFDVVPQCPKMEMNYVFGSEEYPEWVCSTFNDAFGFFVSGPNPGGGNYTNKNIATVGGIPVTINSVNNGSVGTSGTGANCDNLTNTAYYVDNQSGTTIVYDGFTTPLTASIDVTPCQTYHMVLVIGDGQDQIYDSGVFLTYQGINCPYTKSPDSEICAGQTTPLSVTAPMNATYSWAPATSLDNPSVSNPNASPLITTTYTCTINNGTCTSEQYITVNVKTINIGSAFADAVCNGSNDGVVVSWGSDGVDPYSYLWSNGETNNSTFNLTPGTYTVTVTDAAGCKGIKDFTITEPPVLTVSATGSAINCGATTGDIVAISNGGGSGTGIEYSIDWNNWQTNGTFNGLGSGNYTVFVHDSKGCWALTTVNITNSSGVTASLLSQINNVCYGGNNGSLSVAGSGGSGVFDYSIDGGATFQTSGTFNGLSAGGYNVIVRESGGCEIIQSVNILEPTQVQPNVTTNIATCGNPNGILSVSGSDGTPGYTYALNAGAFQTSGTFSNLTAGTYTVIIKDSQGCSNYTLATVANVGPPTLNISSKTNVLCYGFNAGSFTALANGTGGYEYSLDGGAYSTLDTYINLAAGIYVIAVKDSNGCAASQTVTITQPAKIIVTNIVTDENCGAADGKIIANVTGGNGTLQYSIDGGATYQSSNVFTGLAKDLYNVVVKDADGCVGSAADSVRNTGSVILAINSVTNVACNGGNTGSVDVIASGSTGFTYSINGITFQTSGMFNNLIAGSYTVTGKDAGSCLNTTVVTITQPTAVVTALSNPTTICIGQNTTITSTVTGGSCSNYTYNWMPGNLTTQNITVNPLLSTTYTLNVTDCNGCAALPKTLTISLNPALAITAAVPPSFCSGKNTTLNAIATGGNGVYTYSWIPIGGYGNSQNISPVTNTTYTVILTDGCGTPAASVTIPVVVDPLPTASGVPDKTTGCAPLCVNFSDMSTVTPGTITSWSWDFGDAGHSSSTLQDPNYCYQNPGNYSVSLVAISNKGCTAAITYSNLITVYQNPIAVFSFDPHDATESNSKIIFTDQSTGASNWLWTFGNPADVYAFSILQNPTYTYSDTGTYEIKLYVQSNNGCVDSTFDFVTIKPEFTFYVPDAFTPNDDGKNDVFKGQGTYIKTLEMFVFDRWGDQIFNTNDMNKGWDGKANAGHSKAQEDVYVYLINLTDISGKPHRYNGHVTLVR